MKPTLSVVVSAYNEERKIASCLESVSWADEIILIDNSSTDKTAQIARSKGAKVFSRENYPMLNTNKNFGFSKATGDWILNLDADESVPDALKNAIARVVSTDLPGEFATNGYWIPRKNIIFGKWIKHGLWWPDRQMRLFRRGTGKFPCIHVHEYVRVDGRTAELPEPMEHRNYETVSQFLRKMDAIYTENEAAILLEKRGGTLPWQDAIRMPVADFLKVFFFQKGYRDGIHGLVLSLLQGFYALVVFAKAWERQGFGEQDVPVAEAVRELDRAHRDVRYWDMNERLEAGGNVARRVAWRVRRKFRI